MSNVDLNPYAAPRVADTISAGRRKPRWRLIPATFFFLLGCLSLLVGLFGVAIILAAVFTQRNLEPLGDVLAGCSLYLGVGISWSVAGWFYWSERYRMALAATAMGILIPVVLFSILGV
jgi:hypothetical protein